MISKKNLQMVALMLLGAMLLLSNVYAQDQLFAMPSDASLVYINENYDQGEPQGVDQNGISWTYTNKGPIVQAVSIEGRDGKVYESTTTQPNDAYCNINLPECITGRLVIEVDVRANEAQSKKEVLKIGNEDNAKGTVNYLMTFAPENKINVMGEEASTYEVNKWYHATVYLNLTGFNSNQPSTSKLILKDEAGNIISEIVNEDFNVKELKSVRISSRKPEPGANSSSFYIDNLKLYRLSDAVEEVKSGEQETLDERLNNSIILFLGKNIAYVNNALKAIDPNDSKITPITKDGRTLVPVRFISESFGAEVKWDESTSTVSIQAGDNNIKLILGENVITVNGKPSELDVPAQLLNGRTLIPLRALAESLGKEVFWEERGLIIISDQKDILDKNTDKAIIDRTINLFNKK